MNSQDDQRKLNERYLMMTQAPVKRLILKMSVPTIISMLVTSIYNMVDSFFVGHLSTEAVAGHVVDEVEVAEAHLLDPR